MIKTVHIFCRIVDNFGDIGVCWRLARQLRTEHGLDITLWVDELGVFRRLVPAVEAGMARQTVQGIEIRHWTDGFAPPAALPDLVMETFACRLPESLIAAMAAAPVPPQWVNLDHLSAEAWIDDSNGLISQHPATGLERRFIFPGFTDKSGGLIRERSLISERDTFLKNEAEQKSWWKKNIPAPFPVPGTLKVSLFAYPFAPCDKLMAALAAHGAPVCLLLPETITAPDLVAGGSVRLVRYPLLSQPDFDRLLWSCDLNFVRGEDSWIRALWAGRPFVWQAYAQPEKAQDAKIAAFLARYGAFLPKKYAEVLELAHGLWNLSARADEGALTRLLITLPELAEPVKTACNTLAARDASNDCVSRLLRLLNDRKTE